MGEQDTDITIYLLIYFIIYLFVVYFRRCINITSLNGRVMNLDGYRKKRSWPNLTD